MDLGDLCTCEELRRDHVRIDQGSWSGPSLCTPALIRLYGRVRASKGSGAMAAEVRGKFRTSRRSP